MRSIVAATLAALVLTACGGPKERPAEAPQPSTVAATASVEETTFVEMLRERFPMTDEQGKAAVAAGRMVCAEIDGGMTIRDLNMQLVIRQVDPTWAASVVGYGIRAFCPQHLHLLG